jgi:molybdopterin molybdotransferase
MITAAEASACILEHIEPLSAEEVSLADALGRVIASPITSAVTLPPWRNSSMDGYAVRSANIGSLPQSLRVIETVAAGRVPSRDIDAGEATKVMTGAPVPESADSVVRIEDTDRGEPIVTINDGRDLRKNIRPRGEDVRAGDLIARRGDVVTPAILGVLASCGVQTLQVTRRPIIAIVSSGDELVMLDQFARVEAGERIVSANSYTLNALVQTAGAIPRDFGIARDTPESLRAIIEQTRQCDLLVTSAGISVGDHDYTRDVLQALGAEMKFWKVRIRPGAPLAFGMIGQMPWIGLSGNPVSAMVTFELFVRPAIRKMCGQNDLFPASIEVTLSEAITTVAPLTHFLRVVVTPSPRGYMARLTGTQSSAALTSMTRANALLIVPFDRQNYEAGDTLQAIPLGEALMTGTQFPV